MEFPRTGTAVLFLVDHLAFQVFVTLIVFIPLVLYKCLMIPSGKFPPLLVVEIDSPSPKFHCQFAEAVKVTGIPVTTTVIGPKLFTWLL